MVSPSQLPPWDLPPPASGSAAGRDTDDSTYIAFLSQPVPSEQPRTGIGGSVLLKELSDQKKMMNLLALVDITYLVSLSVKVKLQNPGQIAAQVITSCLPNHPLQLQLYKVFLTSQSKLLCQVACLNTEVLCSAVEISLMGELISVHLLGLN